MARVALYRKYRPQNFDELFGQDFITTTLKNSVKNGNFSHAYLFCGPRGTGKTSVARILAKAINCEHSKDGNPDNACPACLAINSEKAMDIIELDAASHTQVDNIRDVIVERVNFAPTNLKYKVYIIDEAHMLSKSSFNALLKTLEEPPAHSIFILATTEANKIIPTIVSRCQRFDFKRINLNDLVKRLGYIAKEEGIKIDDDSLLAIAELSEGGFRDAISILDQLSTTKNKEITKKDVEEIFGISDIKQVEDFAYALAKSDVTTAFSVIDKVLEEGIDVKQFFKAAVEFFRKILIAKLVGIKEVNLSESAAEKVLEITKLLPEEKIISIIDTLIRTDNLYKYSSLPRLGLDVAAAKICVGDAAPVVVKEVKVVEQKAKPEIKQTGTAPKKVSSDRNVQWQEVLLEIKGKNPSIHAFLRVSEPDFSDEDMIALNFPYKFHKERIEDVKNRQIVEDAVSKVCGKKYRIKCLLKPLATAAIVEKPKKDDLLEDALEIFGGEVIE